MFYLKELWVSEKKCSSTLKTAWKLLFWSILGMFCVVGFSIPALSTPAHLLNICLEVILSVLCCFWAIFVKKTIYIGPFLVLLLLFNFIIFVSWLTNGCASFLSSTLTVSLVTICFYQFLCSGKDERSGGLFFVGIGLNLFSLYFIIKYSSDVFHPSLESSVDRIGGFFGNVNWVAMTFSFILFLNFYFAFAKRLYFLYGFCLIDFYLLLLTGSISGIALAILVFVCSLFYFSNRKNRYLLIFFVLFFILVLFALLQLPFASYYKERITGMITGLFNTSVSSSDGDPSAALRLKLALDGLLAFLTKPLFGGGFYGVSSYAFVSTYAHNNFIEVSADFGLFGFLTYECFLLIPMFRNRPNKLDRNTVFLFSLILFLFFSQFTNVIYYEKLPLLFISLIYSMTPPPPVTFM